MEAERQGRAVALVSIMVLQIILMVCEAASAPRDLKYEYDKRSGELIGVINRGATPSRADTAQKRALLQTTEREGGRRDVPSDLIEIAETFGVSEPRRELKLSAVKSYEDGSTRERYQHELEGVAVYGSELIVHRTEAGEIRSVTGRVLRESGREIRNEESRKRALRYAQRYASGRGEYRRRYRALFGKVVKRCRGVSSSESSCYGRGKRGALRELVSTGGAKLYVYSEDFIRGSADSSDSKVVYEVSLASKPARYSETFYLDAKSLRVHKRESNKRELYREIWDCSDPFGTNECWLHYTQSSSGYTFGREEGAPARGPNPLGQPFTGTTDVDYLYDMVPTIEEYYQTKFSRDGGNDRGGLGDGSQYYPWGTTTIFANINAGPYGYICNPGYGYFSNTSLSFCLGSPHSHDLVGHEYGHAITYYLSHNSDGSFNSVVQSGESGALSESLSDILGEAFERHVMGYNDWIFLQGSNLSFIRGLSDPSSVPDDTLNGMPHPDRYTSPDFYCGTFDGGGIHHNSTVPSKAAYLTAVGGDFNGCSINGLGFAKMEQIWYRAVTEYFSTTETFNQAYNSLRLACLDLYSPSDCDELTKALQAVEMDQAGACSGIPATPPACAGRQCALTGSFATI